MAGLVLPAISITASSIVALAIFYFAVLRKGYSNADKRSSKVSRSKDRGVVSSVLFLLHAGIIVQIGRYAFSS